jgi:hypothetical protein
MQIERLTPIFSDAGHDLGSSDLVDVGYDDGGAFLRQQFSDRLANARRSARHQRNFARDLSCHFRSRFFITCLT